MALLRTTTPEQARAQVERMVRERGMTQEEFEGVKKRATELAKALGAI